MRRLRTSAPLCGRCACGAVRFEVSPPWRWFAHCHCSVCRRHHGALFSTSLGIHVTRFRWTAGRECIRPYRFSAEFERPFCAVCASKLPGRSQADEWINVPAGCVTGDLVAEPRTHIFVGSKSPLDVIDDALPRFDAYPSRPGLKPIHAPSLPRCRPGTVAGACLCGRVAFEIDGPISGVVHDHSVVARRSRGSAHATDAFVESHRLRWTVGEAQVRAAAVPASEACGDAGVYDIAYCATCGGLVPAPQPGCASSGAEMVKIPAGALDFRGGAVPVSDVHVAERARWYRARAGG